VLLFVLRLSLTSVLCFLCSVLHIVTESFIIMSFFLIIVICCLFIVLLASFWCHCFVHAFPSPSPAAGGARTVVARQPAESAEGPEGGRLDHKGGAARRQACVLRLLLQVFSFIFIFFVFRFLVFIVCLCLLLFRSLILSSVMFVYLICYYSYYVGH